jgi:hypothetical protein
MDVRFEKPRLAERPATLNRPIGFRYLVQILTGTGLGRGIVASRHGLESEYVLT